MKILGPNVYAAAPGLVCVHQARLQWLVSKARCSYLHRARLCAHHSEEDRIHEMFIALDRRVYIRPHRHLNKSESFHVISGSGLVVFFGEVGTIEEVIEIGDYRSGKAFYYRNDDDRFHTQLVTSRRLLVHETTNGPFRREQTEYAPWSPPEDDPSATKHFMRNLRQQLRSHRRASFTP